MLADILKNNGQEVPFDMPEVKKTKQTPDLKYVHLSDAHQTDVLFRKIIARRFLRGKSRVDEAESNGEELPKNTEGF